MKRPFGTGPTTRSLGELGTPWLLTTETLSPGMILEDVGFLPTCSLPFSQVDQQRFPVLLTEPPYNPTAKREKMVEAALRGGNLKNKGKR